MHPIKATRATIKLGNIELNCFQMPDGSYGYEYVWLADLIGKDKQILSDKKSPYYLKGIVGEALAHQTIKIEGISASDNKKKYLNQQQLGNVLGVFSNLGHTKATDLLIACFAEALDRRADNAFGVQRTEQDRNDRLAARTVGKVARRSLTDAITSYLDRHPELSENYSRHIWSNCSDHLNKIILGAKSKAAKEFYGVASNSLLREHIPVAALNELERTEDLAGRHIDERDLEPLEAVKMAASVMFCKTIGLVP
jgi:hypothetical protein